MHTLNYEMEVTIKDTTFNAFVEATEIEGEDRSVGIFGRIVVGFKIMIFDGVHKHEISKDAYNAMSGKETDRITNILTDLLQIRDARGYDEFYD